MNECRQWGDRLLDYTLDALPPSRADEVEGHLQSCASCAAAADALQRKQQQMEAGLAQLVRAAEASPAFRARVVAAARERSQPVVWQPAWKGVLAAVALVALAAIFLPGLAERWEVSTDAGDLAALSRWRSPTESLLRSPADVLLQETPRLGEFYFPLDPTAAGASEDKGGNNDER
jgi:anti-sigma factor RsiW